MTHKTERFITFMCMIVDY